MSTQELNRWLDSLGDEEVESTFTTNQAISGKPVEDTFEHGISLDDFTGPEIQIESKALTFITRFNIFSTILKQGRLIETRL